MNWINIKTQVPNPHEDILMVDDTKNTHYGTFELSIDGTRHWINDCDDGTFITHWMQIPEPPTEEKEEG